jgi:hypothetical protein
MVVFLKPYPSLLATPSGPRPIYLVTTVFGGAPAKRSRPQKISRQSSVVAIGPARVHPLFSSVSASWLVRTEAMAASRADNVPPLIDISSLT